MKRADAGFTLVELVAVMAIASVLAGIGLLSFAARHQMTVHTGSAEALVAELRSTAQRAIAEGRTYCVSLAANGRAVVAYEADCDDLMGATLVAQTETQDADVTVVASHPAGVTSGCEVGQCIRFTPRGTATPTELTVSSSARPSQDIVIHVEGLTARVWM